MAEDLHFLCFMFGLNIKMNSLLLLILGILVLTSLQVRAGGSDSGGGGQGIYDSATGQVRFVDILSPEQLKRMVPAPYPVDQVFSQFANCTKVSSKVMPDKYYKVRDRALETLNGFLSGGITAKIPLNYSLHFTQFLITAIQLRQLSDASSVAPEYQLQLAIYNDGVSFLQEQAVALMPEEDLKWLFVKEALRYMVQDKELYLENWILEDAVKLIYNNDKAGFNASVFAAKYSSPSVESYNAYKIKILENRVADTNLSQSQRDYYSELLANVKSSNNTPSVNEISLNNLGIENYQTTLTGFLPAWAVQIGRYPPVYEESQISKKGNRKIFTVTSTRRSNYFRGFDVRSGRTRWSVNCSE